MTTKAKFPGWRTMSGAQRRNAKMHAIFEGARELERAKTQRYKPEGGYRIRHCNGNKSAWMIVALRADGSEIDSNGGWTTGYSLDSLLKDAGHLTPQPGDRVELVP